MKIKSIIKIIIIPNENKKAIPDHLHIIDFLSKIRGLLLTRKLLSQGFILVKLKSSLRKSYGRHGPLWNICVTNEHGYVPLVVSTSRSFPCSWFITKFVIRLTRRVLVVEQELLILLEHLNSPSVIRGVRVTPSLVLYVCFVDCYLSFCTLSFGHCVVCSSSIYGFWLLRWYLQTILTRFTEVISLYSGQHGLFSSKVQCNFF
jgi:hypothetical protein